MTSAFITIGLKILKKTAPAIHAGDWPALYMGGVGGILLWRKKSIPITLSDWVTGQCEVAKFLYTSFQGSPEVAHRNYKCDAIQWTITKMLIYKAYLVAMGGLEPPTPAL